MHTGATGHRLTISVDMMTNILPIMPSSDTVETKVDTAVLLVVAVESRACITSRIKAMECLRKPRTTNMHHLQPTSVGLGSSSLLLREKVQQVPMCPTTTVLDQLNHQSINTSNPPVVLAVTAACQMHLAVPEVASKGRITVLGISRRPVNMGATRILSAALVILPRSPAVVPAQLHPASVLARQ